jgi:outer membrane protein OmpA-like peptidoglycan-associated protein
MKKLFLMLAAGMMAASVNAQNTTITANKGGDNWYMGVNVGVATPQQKFGDYGFFKGFAPKLGVRVGKNLTTVFGLALDADVYMLSKEDSKSLMGTKTFVDNMNVDLLGTFNLSNLFAGYQGEPRAFEVSFLAGLGWSHGFGQAWKVNAINSKAALDFTFNLGADKAWQLYIEPAVIYGLETYGLGNSNILTWNSDFKFDSRAALFQLSAGFNYKFGNSNGTHNFVKAQLRDQAEIDGLNAKINELRADNNAKDGQLSAKDQQIADLQKKLADCEARPQTAAVVEKTETYLQPIVIFRQGKSTIDPAQYASVEMVAKYMKNHPNSKVKVQGYASPEGKAELNQKLSEARAEAVRVALVKKYKIAADRVTVEGLGATDKLSEENDFNRVAMFIDTTK